MGLEDDEGTGSFVVRRRELGHVTHPPPECERRRVERASQPLPGYRTPRGGGPHLGNIPREFKRSDGGKMDLLHPDVHSF